MENRSSDVNRLRRLFIKSAHIVATTLSSCSNDALDSLIEKTGKRFDFCVVDEACTCTEMEIMQPISYGMKNLILVGDHKQLQATVLSKVCSILLLLLGILLSPFLSFFIFLVISRPLTLFPITGWFFPMTFSFCFVLSGFLAKMGFTFYNLN